MAKVEKEFAKGKPIYVGMDVHKREWVVTVLCQGEELYHATVVPDPAALVRVLKRFQASEVHTVYEAGPTGYGLHDALTEAGFDSMVTPPSLVPHVGGRVKTDRRDSRKLASMLAGGFLRRIHVLRPEERAHRQLLRTRNQIERHRRQTQNQIKSLLLFHGKRAPGRLKERWSEAHVDWMETLVWDHPALKTSLDAMLRMYRQLTEQYKQLTHQLEQLALTDKYRERATLLAQIPGIGIFTAMAILVELQNIERFRRADQLASYLGLTPSQHSSGERIRMGHITRCGNYQVRTRLVESSWTLIRYDAGAKATYERIKHQTGSGRKAITAIARRLALRIRRVLLDKVPYRLSDGGHLATGRDKKREAKRFVLRRV
ncbi:MAG: IS110 family transposase [Bacteroidota bacterium]